MKRHHVAMAAVAAVVLAGGTWYATQDQCDSNQWQHVYNPQRLQTLKPCIDATGVVSLIRMEPDGDAHIRVHLDAGQSGLLNQENVNAQGGDLVVEPMCEGPVTQADAQAACSGWKNPIKVPTVGAHIKIVGSWVLDTSPSHG